MVLQSGRTTPHPWSAIVEELLVICETSCLGLFHLVVLPTTKHLELVEQYNVIEVDQATDIEESLFFVNYESKTTCGHCGIHDIRSRHISNVHINTEPQAPTHILETVPLFYNFVMSSEMGDRCGACDQKKRVRKRGAF